MNNQKRSFQRRRDYWWEDNERTELGREEVLETETGTRAEGPARLKGDRSLSKPARKKPLAEHGDAAGAALQLHSDEAPPGWQLRG
jgi:hypothetical protein